MKKSIEQLLEDYKFSDHDTGLDARRKIIKLVNATLKFVNEDWEAWDNIREAPEMEELERAVKAFES